MTERFWVLGGEYDCPSFERMRDGTEQIRGPFQSRDEAQAEWRRLSLESSSRAAARFTICSERIALAH